MHLNFGLGCLKLHDSGYFSTAGFPSRLLVFQEGSISSLLPGTWNKELYTTLRVVKYLVSSRGRKNVENFVRQH